MTTYKNGDSWLKKWGTRAGYVTAILLLCTMVYAFTDSRIVEPKIDTVSVKVFHREHDTLQAKTNERMSKIECRQDACEKRNEAQYKVLLETVKAGITDERLYRVRDKLINDTTIPREILP